MTISVDVPDQNYVARGCANLSGDALDQRAPLKRGQGLVAAHAGTASARQHQGRALHGNNDNID
jgi:hypothetical protein